MLEQNMEQYRDIAKDALSKDINPNKIKKSGDKQLASVLDWNLAKAADKQGNTIETQQKVYNIQVIKQKLMKRLQKDISQLDNPEVKKTDKKQTDIFANENGSFYYLDENKTPQTITLGEILTDGEWVPNRYFLDPKTVPRKVRKKYLVENTKQRLQRLLDSQIAQNEATSQKTHPAQKEIYQKLIQAEASKEEPKPGLVAEKMVRNILKKLTFDYDTSFDIYPADAYQDITQKVDFIIHRKRHWRGVTTKTSESIKNIGIQYTTDPRHVKLDRKKRQIGKAKQKIEADSDFQDIVLVSIPVPVVKKLYQEWSKVKKPGGPEKSLDEESQKEITTGVLKDVIPQNEIEDLLQQMSSK